MYSSFIRLAFIRIFLLLRHFFPHLWSNLCDFGSSSYVVFFRNLCLFLIIVKKETWWWTFRFMYTFEFLFHISLGRSSFFSFLIIFFRNHYWKLFFILQINRNTFFSRWVKLIFNIFFILAFLNLNLLKLIVMCFSLNFYSSGLICFYSFYFFEAVKNFFILIFKLLHCFLICLSRSLRELFIRNFLLVRHLFPSFWNPLC